MTAKRILVLFSDAGGGHRSAGEAVAEALAAQYGPEAQVRMVDALKEYAPYPFNRLPDWYPNMVRHRRIWKHSYRLSDAARRTRLIDTLAWPFVRRATRRLVCDHPADAYVCVHWIYLTPLVYALGARRPPLITVISDLVSIHAWWCHPGSDLCLAPSERARQALLRNGVAPEKVHVVGLPVAAKFCAPAGDKAALRTRLGWDAGRPVVLVLGGGEGMGPILEMAQAISVSGLDCELVVVAGRNEPLRAALQAARWQTPTHIYGFTREMPDVMRAADVAVTKAGPGTLSEAFNAGLPTLLYDFLPGQEDGNVDYVEQAHAGLWVPGPEAVVAALRRWIGPTAEPHALARVSLNARKLARPDAARRCAELIWHSMRTVA